MISSNPSCLRSLWFLTPVLALDGSQVGSWYTEACMLLCRQDCLLIVTSLCCGEEERDIEGKRIDKRTYAWPGKLVLPQSSLADC